jgi:glutamate-ammonia-ligase adenylyltransferase
MRLFFESDTDTPPIPKILPRVGDPQRAELGLDRWREACARVEDPRAARLASALPDHPVGRGLLRAMFGNSPFLAQCLLSDPAFAVELLEHGPDTTLARLLGDLRDQAAGETDRNRLMRVLRIAKRRVSLTVAVADITGAWSLEQVTGALSDLADAAIDFALAHLLARAAADRLLALQDDDAPHRGSGLVVLGMGKLGARELNYSSDVDLIVLYDDEAVFYTGPDTLQSCFVRLTRDLIAILSDRTGDGYVFRTDLRLRPDPGSTPVALSFAAAETYYSSVGQNWERAAMIKARPVAGDRPAGDRFLGRIRPFVWRKHLDFAAIQDIHSIKRQIEAHRGGRSIAVHGHNIKLGRGGIREIEFVAQTLQLIWGGREPALRVAQTCEALRRLAAAGHVGHATADDLIEAYRFLRRLEHRLQMIDDRQTHGLPKDDAGLAALAAFAGYDSAAQFGAALTGQLKSVVGRYGELFEEAPALGDIGPLVFTGIEDDPDTLETLGQMGFSDAPSICNVIRGWHHGRYRATPYRRSPGPRTRMRRCSSSTSSW